MKRAVLMAIPLGACTLGPNYAGPPVLPSTAGPNASFVRAATADFSHAPGLARWWEVLDDPVLTGLVADALAHSPTIDQAAARIREAQAQLRQQRVAQLPSLSPSATYVHAKVPGLGLGSSDSSGEAASSSLDFYNLGLNASWELDLFGGGRRGVEQVRATVDARVADLADAQVSLSAQVAQAYVNLREAQARIALNEASVRNQQQQLELTKKRLQGSTVSRLDVLRLQGQLENTQASAIPLGAQRDEQLDLLAVLTGKAPGALDQVLAAVRPVPLPPAQVPVGDPGALIAQRPDVRAAERELAAQTAGIGVSKAKEYPRIKFQGLLGLGGSDIGDTLDPSSLTTLLAPQLSWSFLDFGRNRAATRVSEARRDLAEAKYRQTVLEALGDAEGALSRFSNARAQLAQLVQVQATATQTARMNSVRVRAGTSTLIDQLDVERQRISAEIAVTQAKGQLTQSFIAVNKALGLGWTAQATAGAEKHLK